MGIDDGWELILGILLGLPLADGDEETDGVDEGCDEADGWSEIEG